MIRARTVIILCAALLLSCKHSTKPDPWPVWILYVHPQETIGTGTRVPISGCAQVIWNYRNDTQTHTENCYEGGNYVKVWNRLMQQVDITYFVRCSGFLDSELRSATFMLPAQQGQGREGAEVIVDEIVVLARR